jgi:hypothetical protein
MKRVVIIKGKIKPGEDLLACLRRLRRNAQRRGDFLLARDIDSAILEVQRPSMNARITNLTEIDHELF